MRRLAVIQTSVKKPPANADVKNSKGVNNNNNDDINVCVFIRVHLMNVKLMRENKLFGKKVSQEQVDK